MGDLIDAWFIWWEGGTPNVLWGVKMLWWGRIGQFIQFFSATIIVVEIVGVGKVRDAFFKFTDDLEKRLKKRWVKNIGWAVVWLGWGGIFTILIFAEPGTPYPLDSGVGIIILLTVLSVYSFGVIAYVYLLLNFLGWAMNFEKLDKIIKGMSVAIFAVGFHFSLLAS